MSPEIAVIVCTLDRPAALADALADARSQLPSAAEVVVVDQSADPEPGRRAIEALGDPRIRCVRAAPGLPAARNLGLASSTAPIVWFIDDDVRLRPGALEAHLQAYRDPRVGGVVGRILERRVRPNARRTTNRIGWGGRVRTRLDGRIAGPIETLKGCNMSFRRQAITRAGGFDTGFGGTAFLEDADASTRVLRDGWILRYEPEAALVHLSVPTGGVRTDPTRSEQWRFENTARYVHKHRGWSAAAPLVATFGAIALKRAFEQRRLAAVPELMHALGRGWRSFVEEAA